MASSQEIAKWVEATLSSFEWVTINSAVMTAIKINLIHASETTQYDILEKHESYVEEILRNKLAEIQIDAGISLYEIDEKDPYIRSINYKHLAVLNSLRLMDPYKFEVICKLILEKVGGDSAVTQKTNDGGVDFYAFNLRNCSEHLSLPISSSISVIGQAKRYKDGNDISESDLRKFVGGALLIVDEFRDNNKINVLSPIIYAFWTTSSFHINAKEYAKKMGIWYLDGLTITDYVIKLDLELEIV